jgi:hypothetical protein
LLNFESPQLFEDFEEWDLARSLEDERDFFDLCDESDELEDDDLEPERITCLEAGFKEDLRFWFLIATLFDFLLALDFVKLWFLILMLDLRASSVVFFWGMVVLVEAVASNLSGMFATLLAGLWPSLMLA